MKSFFDATLDVSALPIYLEGSDSSLWQSPAPWKTILSADEMATRRFVRVSDLLALLQSNGIKVLPQPTDSKP